MGDELLISPTNENLCLLDDGGGAEDDAQHLCQHGGGTGQVLRGIRLLANGRRAFIYSNQ
jgi:hypothetical protein